MRRSREPRLGFALAALVGACAPAAPDPRSTPSAPLASAAASALPTAAAEVVTVDADTPMTTPSGSTYVVPKGWTVTTRPEFITLEDPDHQVSVVFVERKEAEGSDAIAAAWKQVRPDFGAAVKDINRAPGRGGWDAKLTVSYDAKEGRKVSATAWRKGDAWFVALSEGTRDGWARAGSQAQLARDSFRAKGVVKESFAGKKAVALDAARLATLEAFIEDGRRRAEIPGVVVAVLQDGKVVFEKGFGVKAIGKPDPVTPNTLFRIASLTKPLTSLMVAALVSEGTFGWDTPVTQLYPGFALGDAALTKQFSMRNALCACSGIPYDNVGTPYEYGGVAVETWFGRLGQLTPTKPMGEVVQESNPLISVAGYVAAHAYYPKKSLADAYDAAMREKVFGPLGMTRTTFDSRVAGRMDHASPHVRDASSRWVVPPYDPAEWFTLMKPSAGAWSTLGDLEKVLAMELANGKTADGRQAFAEATLLSRREPETRDRESSYGLGLYVETPYGVRTLGTAGHAQGFSANMFFLPDHGVGAVILTNVEFPNPLVSRFQRKLFELLFDGRDEATEDMALESKSIEESYAKDMAKIDFAPELAFFESFVGSYTNPLYGEISIRIQGDTAILDVGEWKTALGRERQDDGTVRLIGAEPPSLGWPAFIRKEEGGKVTLVMEGRQAVVFERKGK
ncbi:MAG: serine hydrolase domain-containing protein [Polyangiaceae bacterium]